MRVTGAGIVGLTLLALLAGCAEEREIKLDVKEYHRKKSTFGVPLLEGDCDYPAVGAAQRPDRQVCGSPLPSDPGA